MYDDDPTEYSDRPLIDPAQQAAYNNPYEHNNPYYGGVPPIPPPPPPRRNRKGLIVILFSIICLLAVALTGVLFVIARSPAQQAALTPVSTKSPGASTSTAVLPTPTPTPTQPVPTRPVPTPGPVINPNYTAFDIVNAFDAAGLHTQYVQYGETIWDWSGGTYYVSVHAISSAAWLDNANCTSNCYAANLGLWVYRSSGIAQDAYVQVENDVSAEPLTPSAAPSTVPTVEYVHGRCLLIGAGQTSMYGEVVTQYCI